MREIKFRAWHKNRKKMFSAEEMARDQLTLLTTGKFINVSGDNTAKSEIYDDMIPLQYAGWKDKYGEEVYFDCSIIKVWDSILILNLYDNEYGFICPSIGWVKNERDHWDYSELVYDKSGNCEIIGNKYENPELIEK